MPDQSQNLAITTLAKGATAQLRELIEHADRETAQPIYRELARLKSLLEQKHDFGKGKPRSMVECGQL